MTAKPIIRRLHPAWICAMLLSLGIVLLLPARAQAADVQVRVLVDVADLIFRSGNPYYYDRGHYHPVVVEYDQWRRPVYYRYAPRPVVVHVAPPPRVHVVRPPRPYYTAPPRHHHRPAPHYRVGYQYGHDRRGHHRSGHGRHDSGRGHGHGHRRH